MVNIIDKIKQKLPIKNEYRPMGDQLGIFERIVSYAGFIAIIGLILYFIHKLYKYLKKKENKSPDLDQLSDDKKSCKNGLSEYSKYDNGNKGFLCSKDIDELKKDILSDDLVTKYPWTEYIPSVVGFVGVLVILYLILMSSTETPADYIFWIVILSLIYTTIVTITYKTDANIVPRDSYNPLTYITDKLNFQSGDELKYSFLARKPDGECIIEGTILAGGIESSSDPATYSGTCTKETVPL